VVVSLNICPDLVRSRYLAKVTKYQAKLGLMAPTQEARMMRTLGPLIDLQHNNLDVERAVPFVSV